MKILKFPNDMLRQTMPKFDFDNPIMDPLDLEKLLVETMISAGGIGLAANQIGIKTRVFAIQSVNDPDKIKVYFNPVVIDSLTTTEETLEGCLSFPGVYVKIKRPSKILAKWQNFKGDWEEDEIVDYDCRCFLHEFDHLEGIVFQDRVSPLKWELATKKSKKGIKK